MIEQYGKLSGARYEWVEQFKLDCAQNCAVFSIYKKMPLKAGRSGTECSGIDMWT